jgi:hypothetical protein
VAALNLGNKAHGSDCPSVCGLTDLSACPSIDASICAYVHRFGFVSTYTFVLVCIYIIYIYICVYIHTHTHRSMIFLHICSYPSLYPSIYLPIDLTICPSTHQPVHISNYSFVHIPVDLSACGLDVSMGPSMLFASQPCISPSIDLPMELIGYLQVRLYMCSSIG